MKGSRWVRAAALAAAVSLLPVSAVWPARTRLKDVARVKGVRGNALLGYGLVVGLNKTGDRRQTFFATQSLAALLQRMGVSVPAAAMRVENVAAVMVSAELPPFAQPGAALDTTVASIGDARSLQGGLLLLTPLKAPDGQVYAVAQGPLSLAGFGAGEGGGSRVQVNHLTVGRIPGGATVEREAPRIVFAGQVEVVLSFSDFTTAARLAESINQTLGEARAEARDGRTVVVSVPEVYAGREVDFLARIEAVELDTDVAARVVVNERTGTIVMGEKVRIASVAVAHGALSVRIDSRFQVSQPAPLAAGETVVVPERQIDAEEEKARVMSLREGATIAELIEGLNAIGATPRDIVAILQALSAAGALQAELVII
jgi:flagellar P-ring protein precursor FlgI